MITVPDHADADDQDQAVTSWVQRHATPLTTVDPDASLQDLAPLRRSIGDATVIGLGESVHGAAEEETMKHRVLRVLVEQMGVRSVAWEEDWTVGVQVDRYIRTGAGDLDELMSQMSGQWQSRETADVLRWLRDYNRGRSDKVRFFGVEYIFTRPLAYDVVDDYVAKVAPAAPGASSPRPRRNSAHHTGHLRIHPVVRQCGRQEVLRRPRPSGPWARRGHTAPAR